MLNSSSSASPLNVDTDAPANNVLILSEFVSFNDLIFASRLTSSPFLMNSINPVSKQKKNRLILTVLMKITTRIS